MVLSLAKNTSFARDATLLRHTPLPKSLFECLHLNIGCEKIVLEIPIVKDEPIGNIKILQVEVRGENEQDLAVRKKSK